jgi:hypothetical protein
VDADRREAAHVGDDGVADQRVAGGGPAQVFNRNELLQVMTDQGFQVVREFAVEDPPIMSGAAEQCVHTGWLFRKG